MTEESSKPLHLRGEEETERKTFSRINKSYEIKPTDLT